MPAMLGNAQDRARRSKPGRRFTIVSAVSGCVFALLVFWATAEPLLDRINYWYLATLLTAGISPTVWIVWRFRPRPLTVVTAVSALSVPVLLWLSARAAMASRPDAKSISTRLSILAMYATILPFFWANFRALLLIRVALSQVVPMSTGYCANCGYDLRATPHRCTECGLIVKSLDAARERPTPTA